MDRFFGVAAARLGALIRMASRARNSLSHGSWDLLGVFYEFRGLDSLVDRRILL